MKVAVYEHVMAGGCGVATVSRRLAREGAAMLRWATAQLRACSPPVSSCLCAVHECFREWVRLEEGIEPLVGNRWHALLEQLADRCDTLLLIAPECDGVLSRLVRQFAASHRLLNLSPYWTALFSDKVRTSELLASLGVAHVPHRPLRSGAIGPELAVVKPRCGAGCEGIMLTTSPAQAPQSDAGLLCVSPLRCGLSASVAMVLAETRIVLLPPAYQWIACDDAGFRYEGGAIPLPAHLAEQAHRIVRPLTELFRGERGFVGVDLVFPWRASGRGLAEPMVVEVNPRLTTSFVAQAAATGINLAAVLLTDTTASEAVPAADPVCFWPDGTLRSMQ